MLEHRGPAWRHAPAALGTALLVAATVVGAQVALADAGNPRAPLSPYGEGGFTVGVAAVDRRITITSADDGSYVLGYTPTGGDVVLDLDLLSGERAQPWWYEAATGRTLKMATLASAGVARFPAPKEGGGPAWVLVVDDVAAGYGSPDTEVVAQATGEGGGSADAGGPPGGGASPAGTAGTAGAGAAGSGSDSPGSGSDSPGSGSDSSGSDSGSDSSGSDSSGSGAGGSGAGGSGSGDAMAPGEDPASGSAPEQGPFGSSGSSSGPDGGGPDGGGPDGGGPDGGDDGSTGSDTGSDGDSSGEGSAGDSGSGETSSGEGGAGSGDGAPEGGSSPDKEDPDEPAPGKGGSDQGDQGDQGDPESDQPDGDGPAKDEPEAEQPEAEPEEAPEKPPEKAPEKAPEEAPEESPKGGADPSWDKLAQCESTGNWSINSGNGYYGGLQFDDATWSDFGGKKYAPRADKATKEQQIEIATKVRDARGGYSSWPACSSKLGLPK